jgi:hypothetical protein
MGLGMIETMKIFDAERHEGIKMRVGIHTGKISLLFIISFSAVYFIYTIDGVFEEIKKKNQSFYFFF